MDTDSIKKMLQDLQSGQIDIDQALQSLRNLPFEDIDFANIDHHRPLRCHMSEVIFCPGKTIEQIVEIFSRLAAQDNNVLATRADADIFAAINAVHPESVFEEKARAVLLRQKPKAASENYVAVVTAGTGDIPVAEEARVTIDFLDQDTKMIFDVGVSGLHRLLSHQETLRSAAAVVCIAGMEGALPSVVSGLISVPVIAVPTSVGYGASFNGLAPLLTMINSCAAGVSVVNIDNGFAAGYIAATIAKNSKPL